MRAIPRALRRSLSPLLASLTLALGVAAPLMDTDGARATPVLESEHAPGQCVTGHDHTLCAQIGATRALPGTESRAPLPAAVVAVPGEIAPPALHRLLSSTGHSPRAPPAA